MPVIHFVNFYIATSFVMSYFLRLISQNFNFSSKHLFVFRPTNYSPTNKKTHAPRIDAPAEIISHIRLSVLLVLEISIKNYTLYNNLHKNIILDCDWLTSVQLIPNRSAIFCNHRAIFCNHSAIFCNHSSKFCNKLI